MKHLSTWLCSIAAALLIAAMPMLLGEGPDPEALQATSDSVDDARDGVKLALQAERVEARGAQR